MYSPNNLFSLIPINFIIIFGNFTIPILSLLHVIFTSYFWHLSFNWNLYSFILISISLSFLLILLFSLYSDIMISKFFLGCLVINCNITGKLRYKIIFPFGL